MHMKLANKDNMNCIEEIDSMTHLVIYGAGGGGQKVAQLFRSLGIEIDYFVDSNEKTWGTYVLDRMVYSPDYLIGKQCKIVIASDAGNTEIKDKLKLLGVDSSCVLREQVIFPLVKEMLVELKQSLNKKDDCKSQHNQQNNVFIELLEGYQLGGVENWSYMIANGLKERGIKVEILAKKVFDYPSEWEKVLNDKFSGNYSEFKQCIKELVDYISDKLPCTIILNKQQQLYYAGYLLKQLYPNQVKIISVTHSDLDANYERQSYLGDSIDKFMCVSKKIMVEMNTRYDLAKDKLFYKESPVLLEEWEEHTERMYTKDMNRPVKIAYGARLERVQKRADLLIPLIQELELRKVNYRMDIAGIGSCYSMINDFILHNNLSEKIHMKGNIDHCNMHKFWANADIFINLSESEGIGISMLEAMKCGAVPIEFDISGSDEFIMNDINGYIIPYLECKIMAEKIAYLSQNRELLEEMGRKSKNIIETKCGYEDYIDYLINTIGN